MCVGTDSKSASSSRLRSQSAHNASLGGRYDCSMGEASFDEEADSEVPQKRMLTYATVWRGAQKRRILLNMCHSTN